MQPTAGYGAMITSQHVYEVRARAKIIAASI